ncbi:M14 family zinc carboxypeptidase [Pontibacter liquoris]|uniref:M14 family zinc carboxypeptidase n=1 Tax=Pontibacter liquoris TaxID=2905677 RepID=UPI001FA6E096|nr:M14 family zinc carboxypeptidase [Pontibacter liquoris]
MKNITCSILTLMTLLATQCQRKPTTYVATQAFEMHESYKEPAFQSRRFKHQDMVPLLEELKENPLFEVQKVGESVEKRAIYLVKAGTGKTNVLLWSQMHGDESTATMALFDLFNFLQQSDDLDPVRKQILENITLYVVPMLNPDGAEQFKRRNALEIDLNRDALQLQSPEARLLKSLRDSLNPVFGFNLHDQSRYYAVSTTSKPATISFLAPAYDTAQTVNKVRGRAMRTIVGMNEALQHLIPGQVAKYADEHEPRAFGDNIQKWGTSVILIESGGYNGDPEKQMIRRLNFASMISALQLIAAEGYQNYTLEDYYEIPENARTLFDVVIRNVRYQENGRDTLLDVGVMRDEVEVATARGFYTQSSVQEIGDMRVFYGYEEVDGTGLILVPGKVYGTAFEDLAALTPQRSLQLLREGYTTVRLHTLPDTAADPLQLPLNITSASGKVSHTLSINGGADFVLKQADGQVRYVIVNGFVYDLQGEKPALFHGLIL